MTNAELKEAIGKFLSHGGKLVYSELKKKKVVKK